MGTATFLPFQTGRGLPQKRCGFFKSSAVPPGLNSRLPPDANAGRCPLSSKSLHSSPFHLLAAQSRRSPASSPANRAGPDTRSRLAHLRRAQKAPELRVTLSPSGIHRPRRVGSPSQTSPRILPRVYQKQAGQRANFRPADSLRLSPRRIRPPRTNQERADIWVAESNRIPPIT